MPDLARIDPSKTALVLIDLQRGILGMPVAPHAAAAITTNFGVESSARDAFERSYALVFVEDAMTAMSAEAHAVAVTTIFPRLARIRSTQVVLDALS